MSSGNPDGGSVKQIQLGSLIKAKATSSAGLSEAIEDHQTRKGYRALATSAAIRKQEDEKVLRALFDDDLMPEAKRRLRKVNQVVRRNVVFFTTEEITVKAGTAPNVSQLTQKIQFDKQLLEQYIRSWTAMTLRAKQKKTALEAEVARYVRFE